MNPFVAELATSPVGRPPCRVWQVGGGHGPALDAVQTVHSEVADGNVGAATCRGKSQRKTPVPQGAEHRGSKVTRDGNQMTGYNSVMIHAQNDI